MAAYGDEDPFIEPENVIANPSDFEDSNDIIAEYRKRSKEACCDSTCCCCSCSYYCWGMLLLIWWFVCSLVIITVLVLYLIGEIVCDEEMNNKYGCDFVDIWIGTLFAIQVLCLFVTILGIISLTKVKPILMIPMLLYVGLQFVVAIIQFFIYLFSGIFVIIIVFLEFWVFYKNYLIVKNLKFNIIFSIAIQYIVVVIQFR